MNRLGKIYKAINKITKEVYIGVTFNLLKDRRNDHLQKAKKNVGGKFQQAIRTYGSEAFEWVQIDTANSSNELAEKEKEYVIKYNAKENGYNADSGGGFKKTIFKYNLETKELIQDYTCLNSAAISVNATKQDISRACLSANGLLNGYLWSYSCSKVFTSNGDSRKKGVIQLDLNANIIDEFDSVAEATQKTGLSKTCISRVCRGERDSSGGYIWRYTNQL
ncbi:GIY-YIG nuclease family protein [Gillisia hiemivivida]|uniref:Endonuclease n=1 Tax=Gillisia hiemivivida TaxID=291190 RepID=A0A5C6ZY72_9FLAO|nr:GIY-YIG nuclease family protein [Gillisia hiemivivida]TXD95678.1 endonuclease [Gillisia hiemivivida]